MLFSIFSFDESGSTCDSPRPSESLSLALSSDNRENEEVDQKVLNWLINFDIYEFFTLNICKLD